MIPHSRQAWNVVRNYSTLMQKTFIITFILTFLVLTSSYSQKIDILHIKDWTQLYTSDSIPKMLIYRLGRFNDGYFDIADREKPFESTDVIYDRSLPTRQLRYLGRKANTWVMTYKHGGLGLHYHFVLYQVENGTLKVFISGVSLQHLETLKDINKALLQSAIEFKDLMSEKEIDKV